MYVIQKRNCLHGGGQFCSKYGSGFYVNLNNVIFTKIALILHRSIINHLLDQILPVKKFGNTYLCVINTFFHSLDYGKVWDKTNISYNII